MVTVQNRCHFARIAAISQLVGDLRVREREHAEQQFDQAGDHRFAGTTFSAGKL